MEGRRGATVALNVILLGAPGAGKGTQAERFANKRGIPKISTGDILREKVHAGTEIGTRAKEVMARGELVNDDVMIGIVQKRLQRPEAADGFVLDGFPRTVAQAIALDGLVVERGALIVVDIVVPESELVRRLASRMICERCAADAGPAGDTAAGRAAGEGDCRRCGGRLVQRVDDDTKVVLERLKVYEQRTRPIVEYYRGRPTFRSIDGARLPDAVAMDLEAAVESAAGAAAQQAGGASR